MRNEENPLSRADGLEGIDTNPSRARAFFHEGYSQAFWEAVILALWGFQVVPLRGKRPEPRLDKGGGKGGGGLYHATTDLNTIAGWWQQWPDSNVGARPPHWAVVLDVDADSGGLDSWARINQGHALPTTLVTKTGGGGYHYWYRLPHTGGLKGIAAPGIDVRHHKNLVAMPGSIHPDTGRFYEVENWCAPAQIAPLPTHLYEHVFKPPKASASRRTARRFSRRPGARSRLAEHLIEDMATAPESTRNSTLNSTVFQAVSCDLDILDDLHAAAQHVGLDEREIENTMRSAIAGAERESVA